MKVSDVTLSRATARLGRFDELTDDIQRLTDGMDVAAARERYLRIRSVGRETASGLLGSFDRAAVEAAARRLGLWHRGTVVFGSASETDVLADHLVYHHRVDGENAVERLRREQPPPPGSDLDVWLAAAVEARYAMWLVTGREPGFAVAVRDLFSGEAVLMADVNYSQTAPPGIVLAGRVAPGPGFSWSTGAMLPILDERVLVRIGQYLERTCKRVTDLRTMDPHRALLVESFITRTCLETGSSERVINVDPDDPQPGLRGPGG